MASRSRRRRFELHCGSAVASPRAVRRPGRRRRSRDAADQRLPQRQGAAAARRHRQRHLRAARLQDRARAHRGLAPAARGPCLRQDPCRAFGGRQCARHDRGRQGGRRHRLRRRQRHERVLRAGLRQRLCRPARPHPRGRRARHRLCAAAQEDPGAAWPQGRRLQDQSGWRRPIPLQGTDGGQEPMPAASSICRSPCRPSHRA